MKVARWGNSLAVRLPKEATELLKLAEGDEVRIDVTPEGHVMLSREKNRAEWLEHMRKYRGRLPADFKFDRDEANRRD